jgi:hypothetical protein
MAMVRRRRKGLERPEARIVPQIIHRGSITPENVTP